MKNSEEVVQKLQTIQHWLIQNGISILIGIFIFFAGRWLADWLANVGQRALLQAGVEETLARFLNKLIYYALLTAVVIATADQFGIQTTSLVAILGAAGLAVGLALKNSLANFASGVMLILFHPFKVGDVITAAGATGVVKVIDIFSTILITGDNQKIIIPNSAITSGTIVNINHEATRRIDLTVNIGYQDDLLLAKDTLSALLQNESRILATPAATIAVAELTNTGIQLIARPWVNTRDYWDVRCSLTEKIKLSFDKEGISFPVHSVLLPPR